ncbi:MAG TPA: hypothetical protein VJM33_08230 [Microthrixaceae bacterium]|nr:hypothetical protein [Microthrixaceae bacterium]
MVLRAVVLDVPDLTWSAGAPAPVLVASEDRTLFAFEHTDGQARIAEFVGCVAVRFGFPNDEAQHGHPLWNAGLSFYAAHEVSDSPWVSELRAIEAVHPMAAALPFPEARHFMLTFHDSMMEAVARDVAVVSRHRSVEDAVGVSAAAVTSGGP